MFPCQDLDRFGVTVAWLSGYSSCTAGSASAGSEFLQASSFGIKNLFFFFFSFNNLSSDFSNSVSRIYRFLFSSATGRHLGKEYMVSHLKNTATVVILQLKNY